MSVPNNYKTEPTRTCYGLQQKLPLRAASEFLLSLFLTISHNLLVARRLYCINMYILISKRDIQIHMLSLTQLG